MCTGHTLVVIGEAKDGFFMNADGGFLARFRHQHFLLFLVAHLQRAALHMFSDRLVAASAGSTSPTPIAYSPRHPCAGKHSALRTPLRFYEISNQAQARELYAMRRERLGLDALYRDIREELYDMGNFLDAAATRRQNETVVRLTVVTTFGLIGMGAPGSGA